MNILLTSWFSTYFKWTLVIKFIKKMIKVYCENNSIIDIYGIESSFLGENIVKALLFFSKNHIFK